MINPLQIFNEIERRVACASSRHFPGSSAQVWAARAALEDAYHDGLLTRLPRWDGPRTARIYLQGGVLVFVQITTPVSPQRS